MTFFRNRQIKMLARAGDLSGNRPLWHEGYRRVLQAVELQVQHSRFFFGGRPSIGDFALYGQLSQLAIDPSPSVIMRRDAVRTYQWVQDLDDASGSGRVARSREPLGAGRRRPARTRWRHLPAVPRRQREGDCRSHQPVQFNLNGTSYPNPTRSYKRRCLLWLKDALAKVEGEPRERLKAILARYGCWEPLQFLPGEKEQVPPLVPV